MVQIIYDLLNSVGIGAICCRGEFWGIFSRLFASMCPLAVIALFLSMTPTLTVRERINTAKRGSFIAWIVMVGVVLLGPKVLASIGISQDSFEIAGGLFLLIVGFDMLRSEDPEVDVSGEEAQQIGASKHKKKNDIAITPLGVPLIAGPGAITVLLSSGRGCAEGCWFSIGMTLAAVSCVILLIYWLLAMTAKGTKWLTPMILKLSFRLSGLFLVAIGVQLIMKGIKVSGIFAGANVIS